jgi:hypothetical protein
LNAIPILIRPVLFLATLLALACGGSNDSGAGGSSSQRPAETDYRLVVADTRAESVFVYGVPDWDLKARFDGLKLSTHMGALALPDGRVAMVDDRNGEFVVLQTLGETPSILHRARAAAPAIWGGVDPALEYLVYSSEPDDSSEKVATATLVSLKDYKTYEVKLPMGGSGELHVALGGQPLQLLAATATDLYAFLVSDIVKGVQRALSSTPVNPSLHGAVITNEAPRRLLLSSTESFDVYRYDGQSLSRTAGLAWSADGLSGGRNGRPRLSFDGGFVYGTLAAAVPAEEWHLRQNDVHIVNLASETVRRVPLAPGIIGRFQLSSKYALFPNIQPDADSAILFDTDPASPTFQQIVARIPLERLSNGPVAGETAIGREARGAAMTPDGRWAFVSHGGDARISVIDPQAKAVVSSIRLPTALSGGGYLLAVQKDARVVDTQVR